MTKCCIRTCGIFFIGLLSACGSDDKIVEVVENKAPLAKIVLDISSIVLNRSVTISGETSSDPDGDVLSYEWSIKTENGNDYSLVNNTAESFVFTPENSGTYNVSLVVRDNTSQSELVTSLITVKPHEQSYPIAVISDDMNSKVGKVTWFSAENSSAAEGQLLTYFWQVKSKPSTSKSTIEEATKVRGYLIPDIAGTYEISLTITNAENKLTTSKALTITADELLINSAPVAIISSVLPHYAPEQMVRLNASASYDSDGDELNYKWQLISPSTAQHSLLTDDTTEFVEFTVDGIGEYQISLTVTDRKLTHKTTKMMTVTNQNIAPIANAGPDQFVATSIVLELDGAGSSDTDGKSDNLTYQWSIVSKPSASHYDNLSTPTSLNSYSKYSFVADVVGDYVLALQVFDGIDYSVIDQVHIEVSDNQRPVAMLADDFVVNSASNVMVTSTKSYDPEGSQLNYTWQLITMPEGSKASLLMLDGLPSSFIAIDLVGNYTVQLIVSDGTHDSLPATINVTYTPEKMYELTVTGRLVDEAGLPLAIAEIGGLLQKKLASDEDGNFEVLLQSKYKNAALKILLLKDEDILPTFLTMTETNEQKLNLGTVKLPVLQRKHISLKTCQGYTGSEKVAVNFYLSTDGYENMKFYKPVSTVFTVGSVSQEVKLPANGVINMRLVTTVAGQIYVEGGNSFFTHQYQVDDSKDDPLVITVCNEGI
jgi:hypothetical protein